MYIVMGCLGMPFRGDTISAGKSLGGSESACYYVARELAGLGHRVTVFTVQEDAEGTWDGVDYAWCGKPSPRFPVGDRLQYFVEHTPHDVFVLQRATGVIRSPLAAKLRFLWLHDLALVRQLAGVRQDLYHYDGVLAVSEWHRRQVVETWEVNEDHVHVLPNSVDRTMYGADRGNVAERLQEGDMKLLYQSRPERGLDYLIRPDGIMERLVERRPGAHLYVCGYDNTTREMAPYYDQCYRRIQELPNCSLIGYLSKRDLAAVQQSCDAMVYASKFEETSCITAMEAMCAGLPFLGSECGALPETCADSGSKLIALKDGHCDVDKFVDWLTGVSNQELNRLKRKQLEASKRLSWAESARGLDRLVRDTVRDRQANKFSMRRTMLDLSDVVMFERYTDEHKSDGAEIHEYRKFYRFDPVEHYDSDAAFADIERDENVIIEGNHRFETVAAEVGSGGVVSVLDYGCQKGHYCFSLYERYPYVNFTGVDISPRVIEWASAKAQERKALSLKFVAGDVLDRELDLEKSAYDCILLGEILEHVRDPVELCNRLAPYMTEDCKVVATVPYGEWEGKDYYAEPDRERYHLWHFDRRDLTEMFGHQKDFNIAAVPAGETPHGPLGSYVVSFRVTDFDQVARPVDWERRMEEFVPRETLSFTMIVRDAEETVRRALNTVKDVADEFIIGLDKDSSDRTREIIDSFASDFRGSRRFLVKDIDSPLVTGFDAARNEVVKQARGDWVMWMDSDEKLIYPERLPKYLRHNQYDSYGIAQNHMAADPIGRLNTDWPVRVFRNVPYLKFQGVVHEHPDDVERPNKGPRFPAQVADLHIWHDGYSTEAVRRRRFERNLPLIRRDREVYPDRYLGMYLMMRDFAHLIHFEAERNGGVINPEMYKYAEEGLKLWEELLELHNPMTDRMIRDGLEFYSTLVQATGGGFEADVQFHASMLNGGADVAKGPRKRGKFLSREHFDKFMKICYDEQLHGYDSRYM